MKMLLVSMVTIALVIGGCTEKAKTHNELVDMAQIDKAPAIEITPAELVAKARSMPIQEWIKYMEGKIRDKKVVWEATVKEVSENTAKGLDLKYKIKTEEHLFFFTDDKEAAGLKPGERRKFEGLIQHCSLEGPPEIEIYPARIVK